MRRGYSDWGVGGIIAREVSEGTARVKQKGLEVRGLFGEGRAVWVA